MKRTAAAGHADHVSRGVRRERKDRMGGQRQGGAYFR
jgi:hypothetical protein